MSRVLACITDQHNLTLVSLAAIVCILSMWSTFWILSRPTGTSAKRNRTLFILAAVSSAAGIWSTHFISMLAYDAGLPVRYDLLMTIASLVIIVAGSSIGLRMMISRNVTLGLDGGAIVGVSIAAMHFTGMMAVDFGGRVIWDSQLVAGSIVAGALLGGLSGVALTLLQKKLALIVAPALMTLAIGAMHFTAMTAATYAPDASLAGSEFYIDQTSLAALIGLASALIMLAAVGAALVERFTIARGLVAFGISVFAALVGSIGINAYTIEQLRIGGPNYVRIASGKDLLADILPPPAYIIEAYLAAMALKEQPDRLREFTDRIAKLRETYEERMSAWRDSRQITADMKRMVTEESDSQVQYLWWEMDKGFIPAIERRDTAAAAQSFDRMTANFLGHRHIIEQAVTRTQDFTGGLETASASQSRVLTALVAGTALILLGLVVTAIIMLRRFVTAPVIETFDYLYQLTHGNYEIEVPYVGRDDEIGQMAQAIATLRQAALDKNRLETEMAKKSKLAQLGQLTATVAHEIRNPLGAVKTAAFLIDRKTKDKALGIESQMLRINNGIARCDAIITELLDFTRSKALSLSAQNVDEWVEGVVAEERKGIPQEVRLICEPTVGQIATMFDTGRMRRVLINLLSNAAEAMVGKGNDPSMRVTENPCIRVRTRLRGDMIEIEVADNGPGISEENIRKIREPLFTTKSFGVGLGIPAVENILEQHGGGLRIESTLGLGATMTASFPLRAPEAAQTPVTARKVA